MLPADSDNTSLQSSTSSFPRKCLAVTLERDLLVALPGTALGGTRLVVVVTLALKAAILAPSGVRPRSRGVSAEEERVRWDSWVSDGMSWSLSHRESGKWFSVDFSRGEWGTYVDRVADPVDSCGSLVTTLCMGSTMMTS